MRAAPVALLAIALVTLLATPVAVLAADPVAVSGTVVRDGAPVTGVEVVVSVTGSDQIVAATTDEAGAFAVQVDAEASSTIRIEATGLTSRSEPDAQGCVHLETPIGELAFVVESLPVAAVEVPLDEVLAGLVCDPRPTPRVTPPSTDGPAAVPDGSSGGVVMVVALLAILAGGTLALARRWR